MKRNTCPFLGLQDDPTTALNFPSQGNFCHHAKPAAPVKGDHQQRYCLSAEHTACPVYQALNPQPLPAAFTARPAITGSRRTLTMIGIPVLLAGASALAFAWDVLGIRTSGSSAIPITSMGGPSSWALLVTETQNTPTATVTAEPATQVPPTVCPLPSGWVPYIVTPTDSLYRLSVIYGVSVEELQRVNCLGDETILSSGQVLFVPFSPTNTPFPTITPFIPTSTPKPPERDDAPPPPTAAQPVNPPVNSPVNPPVNPPQTNPPVPAQPPDKPGGKDDSGNKGQDKKDEKGKDKEKDKEKDKGKDKGKGNDNKGKGKDK